MTALAIAPSPMVVKYIVETHLKLYALPTNLSMADIGYTADHLLELNRKLYMQFKIDIEIKIQDTILTISDKLTKKISL